MGYITVRQLPLRWDHDGRTTRFSRLESNRDFSNFIALMLIITMSMNVHLTVRYRELVRDFPELSQKDLVRLTIQKMVRPLPHTRRSQQ